MNDKLNKNEGEGSTTAGREYDRGAETFVKDGRVPEAAKEAAAAVDADPDRAAADEAAARRGPKAHSLLDDVIARERTVVDKVKHVVEHAVDKLRSRK